MDRWETRVPGEVTTREYRNSDGTFTIQSDYILVPSRETHKETLTCVTSYNDELFTDSVTLDIQCKSSSSQKYVIFYRLCRAAVLKLGSHKTINNKILC